MRRSARVILFNAHDQVLLVRFAIVRRGADFIFWATPGGGVEPGEELLEAARREMVEELGLRLPLAGPIHEARDRFEHEGRTVDSLDLFFVGRCGAEEPKLGWHTEAERKAMTALRWWTAAEIEAAAETIFPPDLAGVVRRRLRAGF